MLSSSPLRTLLRTPVSLRPALLHRAAQFHSTHETPPPPYPPAETAILSASTLYIPTHGFTSQALTLGAKDAGYRDISLNLFPRGAFELVNYYLITQRLSLQTRIAFPPEAGHGVGRRVRGLVLERLRANADAGVVGKWQEALGLMSLAENIPASVRELGLLADEIWWLAGDKSVDGSWYSKRATLMGVYAATEVFQTKDLSTGFRDTEEFLDRRLEEVRVVGGAVGSVGQWVGFQGGAVVNLLRSKGVRI